MLVGPDRSGFTVFWKVRLNITSLQIISTYIRVGYLGKVEFNIFLIAANDFTFSRQIKGKQIPYGTAGDCYSAQEGCIQGMLSINLTETSFRLSRSVRWIHNGNRASSQIDVRVCYLLETIFMICFTLSFFFLLVSRNKWCEENAADFVVRACQIRTLV